MKSKYFFSAALPILMLCISLTALAAPPTKPLSLEARVTQLEALLANVSRFQASNGYVTLRFTGMNVQIVNGEGSTSWLANGTGNLIIGYNELRVSDDPAVPVVNDRSGSHMLVIGEKNNYTAESSGGMVVGYYNETSDYLGQSVAGLTT